ncbi:conserved hypothetical protein [Microscilla marina ATCC 23134]|uniref:Putative auto-transporter adhesin head GIN domain-containing protein n=1 Tax=Microscilla marina ATCC 23134 TaxID=313606 RepID=A1ZH46_MICM2|nr:conserved hypothetical protein [Microscilla marina ATCC 23134]
MKNQLRILGIVCLLAVFSFNLSAQNTETRTPGSFNSLSIGLAAKVELSEGGAESIRIEANGVELNQIETNVEDGKLRIRWKKGYRNWKRRKNVKLWITYRSLNKIGIGGSASVVAKSTLKGNQLSLSVSGSGNLTAQVAVTNLKTSISGSGSLRISGKANDQSIKISGSGSIRAFELASTAATVRISGSGSARIQVKDAITARISGSGSVRYKGNPSKIMSKSSGSGSVRSAN